MIRNTPLNMGPAWIEQSEEIDLVILVPPIGISFQSRKKERALKSMVGHFQLFIDYLPEVSFDCCILFEIQDFRIPICSLLSIQPVVALVTLPLSE